MELNTQDYLKKALLDTQERVRDFMMYSEKAKDKNIQSFFKQYAESEAHQAAQMQQYVDNIQ